MSLALILGLRLFIVAMNSLRTPPACCSLMTLFGLMANMMTTVNGWTDGRAEEEETEKMIFVLFVWARRLLFNVLI